MRHTALLNGMLRFDVHWMTTATHCMTTATHCMQGICRIMQRIGEVHSILSIEVRITAVTATASTSLKYS